MTQVAGSSHKHGGLWHAEDAPMPGIMQATMPCFAQFAVTVSVLAAGMHTGGLHGIGAPTAYRCFASAVHMLISGNL